MTWEEYLNNKGITADEFLKQEMTLDKKVEEKKEEGTTETQKEEAKTESNEDIKKVAELLEAQNRLLSLQADASAKEQSAEDIIDAMMEEDFGYKHERSV